MEAPDLLSCLTKKPFVTLTPSKLVRPRYSPVLPFILVVLQKIVLKPTKPKSLSILR